MSLIGTNGEARFEELTFLLSGTKGQNKREAKIPTMQSYNILGYPEVGEQVQKLIKTTFRTAEFKKICTQTDTPAAAVSAQSFRTCITKS